ncbi:Condensation domain-containing protein [Amycolatopsis pretoriensis]|uniref:Condensation domain-containing protein n=1 Tax=Amycolatopsis pretoriensis TaxID=218821 RepID=A0A1H5R4H1_9PSEU|nr:condensation domain-containing protein [Amycolatopsis pretoriensis]SEF33282.1 Condensation domain-containing protein [Amycolatopsis pretoriensis]
MTGPAVPEGPLPLSLNQEFLCAYDKGDTDGAFGHLHTLAYGWRVRGALDVETLRAALDDLVVRHETLRTTITRGDERSQRVHPPSPVELEVRTLLADPSGRDTRAEEFTNEIEAIPFPVGPLPHLRAVLGRFDDGDAVLVLVTHHSATDGWSMQVLMRDLTLLYAGRRGNAPRELPPVGHYRDFTAWQHSGAAAAAVAKPLAYWREQLAGAQILAVPTDTPKDPARPSAYGVHRFLIDRELTAATLAFAKSARSTPFMVLLAAYVALLHRQTGETDVVVPTFTSGRFQREYADSVGPYFNFVALRVRLDGAATLRDLLERVRKTCFDAYANDIPFSLVVPEVPQVVTQFAAADRAVVAFEVLQSPDALDETVVGDLTCTEIRRRTISQAVSCGIPDGGLWATDILPSGEMASSLKYDANLYDRATVEATAKEFRELLAELTGAPDSPVAGS